MGSYGGGDRRVFTGLDPAQPVELFIRLIEQEASVMDHDPAWRCEEALRRIDRGNTPAGIWYSSGAGANAITQLFLFLHLFSKCNGVKKSLVCLGENSFSSSYSF